MIPRALPAIAISLAFAALFWLCLPTLTPILAEWSDDGTYSHGFLLLAVALWLVWREGQQAQWPTMSPWLPGLVALLALLPLYVMTLLAAIDLGQRLLMMAMVPATIAALCGQYWFKRTLPALIILSMAVPIWGLLIPVFQNLTTWVVGIWLDWHGVAARIQGNFITVPAGHFEVAQGCSGLRYLLVASALTLLWGHLYFHSLARTLTYWLVGIALALLTNWIRVYALILVGHYSEMQHPLMADHNNFGWYLFAGALVPLFWIGRRMTEDSEPSPAPAPDNQIDERKIATALTVILVALFGASWISRVPAESSSITFHPPLASTPLTMTRVSPGAWQPNYQQLDQRWHLQYRETESGRTFRIFVGRYHHQRNGAELGQSDNHMDNAPWRLHDGPTACSSQSLCWKLTDGNKTIQVLRWHVINGTAVTSTLGEKAQQLLAQLNGRPDALVITLETECQSDCEAAQAWLAEHAQSVMMELTAQLEVPALSLLP